MIALTEPLDLRGGEPPWPDADETSCPRDPLPESCDIAVVGAGIMGAVLAERLSRDGHRIALLDRRPPAQGSTAASTALVMWAADVPLAQLIASHGAERANAAWRRVHTAVQALDAIIGADAAKASQRWVRN